MRSKKSCPGSRTLKDQVDKNLIGEFRWMSRSCIPEPVVETCANIDSFVEDSEDPDSDRNLFLGEKFFDNAADYLEMIQVSKRSVSLLLQKEAVRIQLEPFKQETKPLPRFGVLKWKMTHISI